MAIFIASTKSISRAKGQSAVASASYRAGEKLYDNRHGKTHDYSKRTGVMSSNIIMPEHLKELSISRAELWNLAEQSEKRKDSRVAREWLINLPHELDEQTRMNLAHTFAQNLADRYGVIADCAIHRPTQKEIERGADPRNFHAHILLTTRQAELKNGELVLDKKADSELSDNDRKKKGLPRMSDEINEVRELWQTLANEKLAEFGAELIDRRSYDELGIDRLPQIKMGSGATALERDGRLTNKGDINRAITEYNELVFNRELEYIEQTNSLADSIIFESRKRYDERAEQQRITDNRIQFANQIALQAERIVARTTDSEQYIRTSEQRLRESELKATSSQRIFDRAESRITDTQRRIEQRAGAGESTADFYYRQFEEYVAQHRNSESSIERTQRIIDTAESFTSESATFDRARESSIERTQSAITNSERIIAESNHAINTRAEIRLERQREQARIAEQEQARQAEQEKNKQFGASLKALLKEIKSYSYKSSECVEKVSNLIKDHYPNVAGNDFPTSDFAKIKLSVGSQTLFEIAPDGRCGVRKQSFSDRLEYYRTNDIFEIENNELKIKHTNISYDLDEFGFYKAQDIFDSIEKSKNWGYESKQITMSELNKKQSENEVKISPIYEQNNDFGFGF